MYKQYLERPKKSVWPFIKLLLFLIVAFIIFYMFHLDSLEIKKSLKKIELEQQAFLENFDVSIFESGYLKKKSGVQEIYIPSLAVRVTNLSEKEFSDLVFYANFQRESESLCMGSASLSLLKPYDTKDVYLRCVDSAIFGSVVSGISLMDAFGKVQYTVTLSHQGYRLTAIEGILDFKVLCP
ncbi:hypothetical protein ACFLRX_02655 [Acidobacteriota bacterium]